MLAYRRPQLERPQTNVLTGTLGGAFLTGARHLDLPHEID
jgi:hypothetical protein